MYKLLVAIPLLYSFLDCGGGVPAAPSPAGHYEIYVDGVDKGNMGVSVRADGMWHASVIYHMGTADAYSDNLMSYNPSNGDIEFPMVTDVNQTYSTVYARFFPYQVPQISGIISIQPDIPVFTAVRLPQ